MRGKKNIPLTYYTDGSCGSKDRIGGWAAVRMVDLNAPVFSPLRAQFNDLTNVLEVSHRAAGYNDTTISRMELSGVIAAMADAFRYNMLHRQIFGQVPRPVQVITDSQYVQKGFTEHLDGWMRRGGLKANGEAVANFDLWLCAKALKEKTNAKVSWVRGHKGNVGNERADVLAGEQRKLILKQAKKAKPTDSLVSGDHEWFQFTFDELQALTQRVPKNSLF
ncbi:RNaseH [Pseudomonas phage vB_PpuM-Pori-4]